MDDQYILGFHINDITEIITKYYTFVVRVGTILLIDRPGKYSLVEFKDSLANMRWRIHSEDIVAVAVIHDRDKEI